jgi:hypothetical protein
MWQAESNARQRGKVTAETPSLPSMHIPPSKSVQLCILLQHPQITLKHVISHEWCVNLVSSLDCGQQSRRECKIDV